MFTFSILLASCIAAASSLQIVPMTEWSGRETLRKEVLATPVNIAVIQHTVTKECNTDDKCVATVKSMQNYQIGIGYDDIGYSFMIAANGKVYEGAGWQKVGAHTRSYNDKSIGIAFIGNFHEKRPTTQALQAAQDLLNYGVENNYLAVDYKLLGHRQLTMTISPGDVLYEEIQHWPHWTEIVNEK